MSHYSYAAEKIKLAAHMLRKVLDWIYTTFLKRGDEDPTISTDGLGFTITKNGKFIDAMHWPDVRKVCLYQKDLFTLELIYVSFVDEHDRDCTVDELMNGYRDFLLAADKHFPGLCKVEELFAWNAAGRFSNVEPLWFDIVSGSELVIPEGYITRRPNKSKQIRIPF